MLLWSGLLVALPAYVLYRVLTPTPIPARTYPQPNGWNSLTAAMKAIQSPYFVEYDSAKPAAFDIAFQEKPGGYARLRDALTHDSLARFDFHIPFLESRDHVHLQDFRWLARAVSTEAERAAFEERLDDAAAIYADSIELGQRITSDGMLIHALVGAAIQNMGNRGLAKVRHRLPPTVSTRIARRLFEIEERREPFPRLLSNDRIWMQHALGWHGRTTLALADFAGEELEVHTIVRRAYLRATMLMRLLITELAIQAYADEHGQPPAHLEMVWPDIVPSAVIDPFSGRPLRYRKSGTDWLVYSVGYDRDDDGGRPPGNQDHVTWEDGDISLDGWWKWLDDQGAYWP